MAWLGLSNSFAVGIGIFGGCAGTLRLKGQRVMQQTPLDRTYLQSYLMQAGIRFDFNLVDTICRRKLNLSFYLALIAALLVFGLPAGMPGSSVSADESTLSSGWLIFYSVVLVALVAYLLFYLARWAYFVILRAKLRRDDAPLAVEAYAVVCLDVKRNASDYIAAALGSMIGKGSTYFCKYAVIYKEVGTNQPRFFLTAATSSRKLCFVPEHLGLVFLHRKKAALYTLDDQSSYQTASAKRSILNNVLVGDANMSPLQGSELDTDAADTQQGTLQKGDACAAKPERPEEKGGAMRATEAVAAVVAITTPDAKTEGKASAAAVVK